MNYSDLRSESVSNKKPRITVGLRGMLRGSNIAMVALWTMHLMVSSVAMGQRLDNELARQAFAVTENWVARGQVPERTVAIEASDVAAVHVTLRFEGVTLGQATAAVDDPRRLLADRRERDFMPLVLQATDEAMALSRQSLLALSAKPGGDRIPQRFEDVAPLIQLDLQLAYVPEMMAITKLDRLAHVAHVGLHGLAMYENDKWAWMFPGTVIASNLTLPDQLNRMLRQSDSDVMRLAEIGKEDGPVLYRFEALHLIRPNHDRPAVMLQRGQQALPIGPLSERSIDVVAKMWADHLLRRQQSNGTFTGTYQPTADKFEPQQAPTTDAMLACYALARFSRLPGHDETDATRYAEAAKRGVVAMIDQLQVRRPQGRERRSDDDPPDAGLPPVRAQDAAMTLLALLETPGTADLRDARDRLAGVLLACSQPDGNFRSMPDRQAGLVSRPAHALATLALVRMYDQSRQEIYLETAQRSAKALWLDDNASRLASIMPWAAEVEFDLLRLGHPTPGLLSVRRTLDVLWANQVEPAAATGHTSIMAEGYVHADTVGGIKLETGIVPEPTWLSAGPLAALASAARLDTIVARDDRPTWLLDCATGLRFVYQLTMTADASWYVHNLTASVGGVRTAFWDNRQPLSATAMALLAAAEMQRSLHHMTEAK